MLIYLRTTIYKNYLYRTRDYAFFNVNKTCHGFCFCACHQDRFRMLMPRSRQYSLKSTLHRDKFPATYETCTATLVKLKSIPTWTAKTRAIPSLPPGQFRG